MVIHINSLRLRQDGHHFPDDIFICIFLNENEWHSIKILCMIFENPEVIPYDILIIPLSQPCLQQQYTNMDVYVSYNFYMLFYRSANV